MPVNVGRGGEEFNVGLQPMSGKTLDGVETLAPAHLEIYNAVRTDAGFFKSRSGYEEKWNLGGGVDWQITGLIPVRRSNTGGLGFAFATSSSSVPKVVELLPSGAVTYSGPGFSVVQKPSWVVFDGMPIVAGGSGAPIKLRTDLSFGTNTYETLGGSPPSGLFVSVLADRVILSGMDSSGTKFQWSSAGSAESWPSANFSNVTGHAEAIRWMQTKDTDLYFFKDFSIEVWSHIGGREVFGRKAIIQFLDKSGRSSGLVKNTVVMAGDPPRFFWYADGDFWVLDGFTPKRISMPIRNSLKGYDIAGSSSIITGYDYSKEHIIRWTMVGGAWSWAYDYVNDVWTEDRQLLPPGNTLFPPYFRHYMESGGQQYMALNQGGDRIFRWGADIYQDDGAELRVFRRLRFNLDPKGNHRARWNRLIVRGLRGMAPYNSHATVTLRWVLDGERPHAQSPSEKRTAVLPLGDVGPTGLTNDDNMYFPPLTNLGVGRDVTLEIEHGADAPFTLTHLTVAAKALGR